MDDQQRARELLAQEYTRLGWPSGWARMALSGEIGDFEADPVFTAITAALRAAPEGFVLVPLNPTAEMEWVLVDWLDNSESASECYAAMLAARPQGVKDA